MSNVYTDNGYKNRKDYLQCLSEDYDVSIESVHRIANLYGPEEDFDGLVSSLQDLESIKDIGAII